MAASSGPIRTLTTVVRLVNKTKMGIRGLVKSEAAVKRHVRGVVRAYEKQLKERIRQRKREIAAMRRHLAAQRREFRKHLATVKRLGRTLLAAFAIGASGVTALSFLVYQKIAVATAKAADAAAVMAQQLGLSADAVQEIEGASDLAGTKFSEVRTAIRRMGDNAEDATRGVGMAVNAFRELGITNAMLKGDLQDNDKLLSFIIQKFEGLSKRKVGGLQAQIFGRAGAKAGPLFNLGLEQFEKFRKFTRESGAVVSKALTETSQRFIDQGIKVKMVIKGIRNELAANLLPTLTKVADAMVIWWMANKDIIIQKLQFWMGMLKSAADGALFVFRRIDNLVRTFTSWGTIFSVAAGALTVLAAVLAVVGTALTAVALVKGFIALKAVILGVVAAGGGLTALLMTWVVVPGLVVAAITALFLVFEDFVTFLQGGESVFGHFLEWLGFSAEGAENLRGFLVALAGVVKNSLVVSWNAFKSTVQSTFKILFSSLGKLANLLKDNFGIDLGVSGLNSLLEGDALQSGTSFLDGISSNFGKVIKGQNNNSTTNNTTNNNSTMNTSLHGIPDPVSAANSLKMTRNNSRAGREA